MVVKNAGEVPPQNVDDAVDTEIEWLIDRHDGAPNFELRRFRIKPGGRIPKHINPDAEHEQYVLKGDYDVGIGEEVYHVKVGDSLYIPAGAVHWYENHGSESVEFLCIVPKRENYKSVFVEDSSRDKQ